MSQNYDDVDMSFIADEVERLEPMEEGGDSNYLEKFVILPKKEGYIIVRLLPPAKGKKFVFTTRTHRFVKNEQDAKKGGRNFHCPRELTTTKNGKKFWLDVDPKDPCPACLYSRVLWSEVEAAGKETPEGKRLHAEYGKIKAIERHYYNCMVRVYDENDELVSSDGPKVLSVGKSLHEKILRKMYGDVKSREKGLGNVAHIMTGRDLKIIKKFRSGQDYAHYEDSYFLDPSPLGVPEEEWASKLHDLAALRVVKPTSEIDVALQKYTGALPDDDVTFDVSKYRKPANTAPLEKQVTLERQKMPERPPTPMSKPKSDDEVMAEADWVAGIAESIQNAK